MHCSLPSSSPHWDSPGKNTGAGSLSLLLGVLLTQELNWGLLYCKQILYQLSYQGSPSVQWLSVKEYACECRRHQRRGFDPWVGKIPWSGKWQPALVFLPGKFHGHSILAGYSPWGCNELDTTVLAHTHTHTHTHTLIWLQLDWLSNIMHCTPCFNTLFFPPKVQDIIFCNVCFLITLHAIWSLPISLYLWICVFCYISSFVL